MAYDYQRYAIFCHPHDWQYLKSEKEYAHYVHDKMYYLRQNDIKEGNVPGSIGRQLLWSSQLSYWAGMACVVGGTYNHIYHNYVFRNKWPRNSIRPGILTSIPLFIFSWFCTAEHTKYERPSMVIEPPRRQVTQEELDLYGQHYGEDDYD